MLLGAGSVRAAAGNATSSGRAAWLPGPWRPRHALPARGGCLQRQRDAAGRSRARRGDAEFTLKFSLLKVAVGATGPIGPAWCEGEGPVQTARPCTCSEGRAGAGCRRGCPRAAGGARCPRGLLGGALPPVLLAPPRPLAVRSLHLLGRTLQGAHGGGIRSSDAAHPSPSEQNTNSRGWTT